jgi:hypothetical protein
MHPSISLNIDLCVTDRLHGKKTANINSKKWQSLLRSVVIGHQCTKTAKITRGEGGRELGRGLDEVT